MGFEAALRVGMENFSKYGKLIGTGKTNGFQVFESLVGGKKILTTVNKDGNVVKTVTKSTFSPYDMPNSIVEQCKGSCGHDISWYDGRGVLTEVDNVAKNSTFSNMRVLTPDGDVRYQRLIRTEQKEFGDGKPYTVYESLEQMIPRIQKNDWRVGAIDKAQVNYINRVSVPNRGGNPYSDTVTFSISDGQAALKGEHYIAGPGKYTETPERGLIAFDSNGHIYNDSYKNKVVGTRPENTEVKMPYRVSDGVYLGPQEPIYANIRPMDGAIVSNTNCDKHTMTQLINNMQDFVNKLRGVKTVNGKTVK